MTYPNRTFCVKRSLIYTSASDLLKSIQTFDLYIYIYLLDLIVLIGAARFERHPQVMIHTDHAVLVDSTLDSGTKPGQSVRLRSSSLLSCRSAQEAQCVSFGQKQNRPHMWPLHFQLSLRFGCRTHFVPALVPS